MLAGIHAAPTADLLRLSHLFKEMDKESPFLDESPVLSAAQRDEYHVSSRPRSGIAAISLSADDLVLAVCSQSSVDLFDLPSLLSQAGKVRRS